METFLTKVENTINKLEKEGFNCGKLTTKERVLMHNLLQKSI